MGVEPSSSSLQLLGLITPCHLVGLSQSTNGYAIPHMVLGWSQAQTTPPWLPVKKKLALDEMSRSQISTVTDWERTTIPTSFLISSQRRRPSIAKIVMIGVLIWRSLSALSPSHDTLCGHVKRVIFCISSCSDPAISPFVIDAFVSRLCSTLSRPSAPALSPWN